MNKWLKTYLPFCLGILFLLTSPWVSSSANMRVNYVLIAIGFILAGIMRIIWLLGSDEVFFPSGRKEKTLSDAFKVELTIREQKRGEIIRQMLSGERGTRNISAGFDELFYFIEIDGYKVHGTWADKKCVVCGLMLFDYEQYHREFCPECNEWRGKPYDHCRAWPVRPLPLR